MRTEGLHDKQIVELGQVGEVRVDSKHVDIDVSYNNNSPDSLTNKSDTVHEQEIFSTFHGSCAIFGAGSKQHWRQACGWCALEDTRLNNAEMKTVQL